MPPRRSTTPKAVVITGQRPTTETGFSPKLLAPTTARQTGAGKTISHNLPRTSKSMKKDQAATVANRTSRRPPGSRRQDQTMADHRAPQSTMPARNEERRPRPRTTAVPGRSTGPGTPTSSTTCTPGTEDVKSSASAAPCFKDGLFAGHTTSRLPPAPRTSAPHEPRRGARAPDPPNAPPAPDPPPTDAPCCPPHTPLCRPLVAGAAQPHLSGASTSTHQQRPKPSPEPPDPPHEPRLGPPRAGAAHPHLCADQAIETPCARAAPAGAASPPRLGHEHPRQRMNHCRIGRPAPPQPKREEERASPLPTPSGGGEGRRDGSCGTGGGGWVRSQAARGSDQRSDSGDSYIRFPI